VLESNKEEEEEERFLIFSPICTRENFGGLGVRVRVRVRVRV